MFLRKSNVRLQVLAAPSLASRVGLIALYVPLRVQESPRAYLVSASAAVELHLALLLIQHLHTAAIRNLTFI